MSERVLSIQSHVASGYVGGKAAVFPLQCLGFDVDVVNTVNFSNHSGYRQFDGTRTTAEELSTIFGMMEKNGLLSPSRLLTGYIPGASGLTAVAQLAVRLRQWNPSLIYLLDPVLGDQGRLYVAPDVIPIYRSMLPLATAITPNFFEAEVLTEIQIIDPASLRANLKKLHEVYQVPNVVISSMPLKPWLLEFLPEDLRPPTIPSFSDDSRPEYLLCISSSSNSTEETTDLSTVHAYCIPSLPGYFTGVGDLFSAMVLAHLQRTVSSATLKEQAGGVPQTPLSYATSIAIEKTHGVMELTHEYSQSLPEEDRLPTDDEKDEADPARRIRRMRGRELRVVQGQDVIRNRDLSGYRWMLPWTNFWTS